MKEETQYYAQSTLYLRLLAGGYLCYTAWKIRESVAENPLFIIAIVAFAVVGAALMVHAGRKLFRGEYEGGPAAMPSKEDADADNDTATAANTAEQRRIHMNLNAYKEQVIETVIEPMLSFMDDWDDCDYTTKDVEACQSLICDYLEALAAMTGPSDDAIMEQVKRLVLALNDLNESSDYSLIETDAREAICEVIQTSALACGLKEYGDDITEEWREW